MLQHYCYNAKCTRVIDGDSVILNIDLGFYTWLNDQRCRLHRIDTPTKDEPGFAEAKTYLANRIEGKKVAIESVKKDKYGRWLVELYDEEDCLNDELLQLGLAKKYE